MYEEQKARMVKSCIDTMVIPGQRTITHNYTVDPDRCKEGTIAAEGYRGRIWRDGTNQAVIEQMNKALGTQPEKAYHIVE